MKYFRRTNSGITLIALVITIIVLLILAGVSIATLTGENGILTRANDAKTSTELAEEDELRKLRKNNNNPSRNSCITGKRRKHIKRWVSYNR